MSITTNLERLRNEIADACAASHRNPTDVALMAVSKTHPAEAILEAHAAGQHLFGENRVQEFASKREALSTLYTLPSTLSFHLIGPLQSNKTTRAAELFQAIDTVDSLKTATRLNEAVGVLNQQNQTLNKTLPLLLEIKLSHEDSKHGLAPEALPQLLRDLAPLTNITIAGLMTVPPFTEDPEQARPYFQTLRRLRDENQKKHPTLTQLSMGMSHDFRIAIAEGSTTVRIGTAIFGKREYPQP